ncbi:hypothetical protein [Acuticoccus sediminis]|uniref:hypothetical protein n=1 Tax=Acuticoccus sediminis TaxID=2184697 RepID=UPI001CFE83A9|nr:hypothetical protein [Acuticoccus sediminis]
MSGVIGQTLGMTRLYTDGGEQTFLVDDSGLHFGDGTTGQRPAPSESFGFYGEGGGSHFGGVFQQQGRMTTDADLNSASDFGFGSGGDGEAAAKIPGLHKVGDVTLKRGIVGSSVPGHTPEWTNHNDSDPGTTVVEAVVYTVDELQSHTLFHGFDDHLFIL